ncbi:type II secretion system F family protein [Cryptosporangium aurantiacum]|uniref:Tight adherence protein C n=1 Tax=Cryptosporangium aurantiacum TaxID=134849 RepID=A0A1M7RN79_9ACTN|nr:type II secretion system F family protein [Cryptosporangium aurantiacum]SHN47797.1 tight adherence protein C [Cryptosporangium aurantiacum]
MSGVGGLLGLVFALGLALVTWGGPPARRPRLDDRLAPYLGRAEVSRAVVTSAASPAGRRDPAGPGGRSDPGGSAAGRSAVGRRDAGWSAANRRDAGWAAAGRAVVEVLAERLDRVLGGGASLQRRLVAAGLDDSVPAFRADQVRWAGVGSVVGAALGGAFGGLPGALVLALVGALAGVLGRDRWLAVRIRRRTEALRAELPVIAELLALAVTAGEAPAAALRRVAQVSGGELGRELTRVLDESRSGVGLVTALDGLAARSAWEPLVRFVDGLVVALDRGTPLAEVLRAQAADAREAGKRSLLESGGRREIAMMVPVVFGVLPVTVLFALYPGLVAISLLSR